MQKRFETIITGHDGLYILRGKLHKDERFSLALVRIDLTDRWYNDFNPLFIHDLAQKVGNIKKMMVFWEILSNYQEENQTEYKITVHNDKKEQNHENQRKYLVIEEKTRYSTVKYPLPLENLPFTVEEFQDNLRYFYSKIQSLESTRILNEKEMNHLKKELYNSIVNKEQIKKTSKRQVESLKKQVESEKQKVYSQKMLLTSIQPKKKKKKTKASTTIVSISDIYTDI